jgi:uncharacterized protein (TIGR01777 family)
MRVGLFGASGFVGTVLRRAAEARGVETVCFSRRARVGFQPFQGPRDVEGLDAVVNLAGEPILGIWTASRRQRIVESRVAGTRRIVEALRGSSVRTLVNASAVGFYGDTGEEEVSESSPAGEGFLAETCQAWESAAVAAEPLGVRVVRARIGFVIGTGGAMALIRPLFSAGAGGNLGSGRQWMSCIHVEDVAGMILWALATPEVSGPLNAVMPQPVRNAEFTKTLAAIVRRPAIFPAPAFALRLALGDLSHVMLDSARVRPSVALQLGYPYRFPDLTSALRAHS